MGIYLVSLITAAMVVLSESQEYPAMDTYQVCDQHRETIACNSSLILITNITNQLKQTDVSSFENLRRDCMGKTSCDPRRVCEKSMSRPLTVHYTCVDKTYIRSSSCSTQAERVTDTFGYIQSPGYPAASSSSIPCSWIIDVPDDKVVIVLLHDFVTMYTHRNHQDNCQATLAVSGTPCQGDPSEAAGLCGKNNITSLIKCGKTEIKFISSYKNYEVRYWLSFCVFNREQISTFSGSALLCPILRHNMSYGQEIGSKGASGTNSQDSNTEVLIIMLSIVGGIAAVLLIILIVICVRCRKIQVSGAESLYSDPSPSVQPHYEYVSTSDIEKARPHLADGYFQVADALPFVQRVESPTSPQYAEVEHVADIRKMLHLVSSEEYPRGSKYEERPGGIDSKNAEHNQTENNSESSGIYQTKTRGTLKTGSGKTKQYENITGNKDVEITSNCVGKETTSTHTPVSSQVVLNTHDNREHETCSVYETIGKSLPVRTCLQPNKRKHSDSGGMISDVYQRSYSAAEGCSKQLQEVGDNAKTNSAQACDGRSTTRPQTTDHTYFVLEKRKQSACHGKSKPADTRARSKSLPSANSAMRQPTSDVTKKQKRSAVIDIPPATGIVRNGIIKFEQNSA